MKKFFIGVAILFAIVAVIWITVQILLGQIDEELPDAIAQAVLGVLGVVVAVSAWLFLNRPPKCETGLCRPQDYTVIGLAGDFGIPGHEPLLRCRCGRKYLRRGRQFLAVNERNYLEKYMIKPAWYSPWKLDLRTPAE